MYQQSVSNTVIMHARCGDSQNYELHSDGVILRTLVLYKMLKILSAAEKWLDRKYADSNQIC